MGRSYEGTCANCGETFLSGYPYRLYCSPECRQEAASERMRKRQPLPPARRPRSAQVAPAEPVSTTSSLEVREWNGVGIRRRGIDGYVNATAMCKANGKHLPHYMANARTFEYLQALSRSVGFPTDQLVQSITTGPNHQRGTWVHPRLAVDLARWISPAFAVWMDGWFLETLTGRPAAAPTTTPPTTPGITVTARTEREAMGLWHAAIEAEVARALRLTLGTAGTTDAGLRVMTRGPWRYVAC